MQMARNTYIGLTDAQVLEQKNKGLVNTPPKGSERTTADIIRKHTLTYFNLINIILAILVLTTGQIKNTFFMGIVIANALIGIIQELRVKKIVEGLAVVTASTVTAIRNGKKTEIPISEIVVDDLILLTPGVQLAADGHVEASDGLEINEAMLTGEGKPVRKRKGEALLSGTFVSAGTGIMKIDKVGENSYAAQIVSKAKNKKRASSQMQRTIGLVIRVISVTIIPIGLLLYVSQLSASHGNVSEAILRSVSGVIGMIPGGLVLLTSVSFIIGVGRLAAKKALVQEMESIEALARTTVLCTDKTGTITTGNLTVRKLLPLSSDSEDSLRDIMREINAAFSDTNPTQDALIKTFGQETVWAVRDKIPFSSARKYRAVSFKDHGDYVLGAPEFLVKGREKLLKIFDSYSEKGYRVLVLGRATAVSSEAQSVGEVTPIAAIVLSDIVKKEAMTTFKAFAESGVAVKVISGDNPKTVSAVALKAGVENADRYVDATTLPDDLDELRKVIGDYTIFGRVKPEQKQLFVKAWQANGETVAMVGDGVNDVLAIKDADCGIAMANGAEAAKQAAHIVLTDSDFTAMKSIVREGRTIIANIERVSSLYLTKTIYSVILALITIIIHINYPFTTLQIDLINLTCIGMPSFFLTVENRDKDTSDGFLRHILKVAAPSAFTMVVILMIIQILSAIFGWTSDIFGTFTMVVGGFVAMLVVLEVLWPIDSWWRRFILGFSTFVFVGAIILIPGFFDIHPITMWWSLIMIPLGVAATIFVALFARLMNRVADRLIPYLEKMKNRIPRFFRR